MRDQLTLMEKAGFMGVELVGKTPVKTSSYTFGALFRALCKK